MGNIVPGDDDDNDGDDDDDDDDDGDYDGDYDGDDDDGDYDGDDDDGHWSGPPLLLLIVGLFLCHPLRLVLIFTLIRECCNFFNFYFRYDDPLSLVCCYH